MALCSRFTIVPCEALAVSIVSICGTASAGSIRDTAIRLVSSFTTHSESDRMTMDLLVNPDDVEVRYEELSPGATILRKFAQPHATSLLSALDEIVVSAPFRRMITP